MSTLNAKVILNIKTATEWANSTDILLEGEVAIESDTRLVKVGNGADVYSALPYTRISDINGIEGVAVTSPTDGQVLTYSNGVWSNVTPPSLPADTDLSHYDNNTSGFITASDIPALPANTDLSDYDNSTSDFATVSQIPTDVSELNNDAGYITSSDLPSVGDGTITIQKNSVNVDSFTTNQNTNKAINITVPTNLSELNNDVGYITSATLPPVNNGTLTIRQDGNTIATFTANSATNVVANLVGGGGGGGGGASYTSQLTVDSSLIPDTDSVYNLGDSTHRWTYLYSQYLSTGDGSATTVEQSIIPSVNSSFNLGSSSYGWDNVYTDNLVLNGTSYNSIPTDTGDLTNNAGFITSAPLANYLPLTGGQMTGNITVSGTHVLGSASQAWSTVYASQVKDNSNTLYVGGNDAGVFYLTPTATATINNLGSANRQWTNVYTANVLANSTTLTVGGNDASSFIFTPSATALSNTLGTAANPWDTAYISEFYPESGATDISFAANIIPINNNSYAFGSSTNYWSEVYSDNVYVNTLHSISSNITVEDSLIPNSLGTITLGNTSNYWSSGSISSIAVDTLGALNNAEIVVSNDLLPDSLSPCSLGGPSSSNYWTEGYITTVVTDIIRSKYENSTNVIGFGYDNGAIGAFVEITPQSNSFRPGQGYLLNSMTLGSAAAPWSAGYFSGANIYSTDIRPTVATNTIGTSTVPWGAGYFNGATISSTGINPTTYPEYLGGASNIWYSIHTYNVKSTARVTLQSYDGGTGCSISLRGGTLTPDTSPSTTPVSLGYYDSNNDLRWNRLNIDNIYFHPGGTITHTYNGTTTTEVAITVNGKVYTFGSSGSGTVVVTSDREVKKNIIDMPEGALEIIKKLRPVKFDFIFEDRDDSYTAGFIAQETDLIVPNLTTVPDLEHSDNKYCGIDYAGFVPYLVKAVQELSSKVDELNAKIKAAGI